MALGIRLGTEKTFTCHSARMRIVHVTSCHRACDARIFAKECRTLAGDGYEIVYVVPHQKNGTIDGIRLHAVPICRGRLRRMTGTGWRVYRAAVLEHGDVYHLHDPELFWVGLLLKAKGKVVVYDAHEDLPRQIMNKYWIPFGMRKTMSRLAELIENTAASLFDGVVAATPGIAARFHRMGTTTALVQNYPQLSTGTGEIATRYCEREGVVVYIGGIEVVRGIREMIRAVGMVGDTRTRLVLAGEWDPPILEDDMKGLPEWSQVSYVGWLSSVQIESLLSRSRIGLVTLHPTQSFMDSYPVKLFEYMEAGIPVIASDFPLWRQIIEAIGCGLLVDPLSPKAISRAITWMLENPEEAEAMGWRGRQAVIKTYNWDGEAKKLLGFYKTLHCRPVLGTPLENYSRSQ